MTSPAAAASPIALRANEGEALWFMGALATIKASSETTDGQVAVIELLAPQGVGPPLHVHHREDEWFYVNEGAITFWVGGELIEAPAGSFVYGPRDIRFESFMRAVGQPASTFTIPPPAAPPSDPAPLIAAAAECGIDILGPPRIPA
jgi:mannose-6-phosphate isomerase-like protein (cupin superfamily)